MRLAKVVGNVVATRKTEMLIGKKLMLVRYYSTEDVLQEGIEIVGDCVGAGVGDKVMVARGGSASSVFGEKRPPLDSTIIGIVDSVEVSKSIEP